MKSSIIKSFCALLFVLIIIPFSSCSSDNLEADKEENQVIGSVIENEILKLVNAHRTEMGKETLKISAFANSLAKEHTNYMIAKKEINHDNFGERSQQIMQKEKANSVAENVAAGQNSAQSVMTAWLNSEGHRKNIEGDFTHIGISALKNKSGVYYYTQLFYKK